MIPFHPLDGAFQRIDRAEEHFVELKQHVTAFRQDYLQSVGLYFDPNPPHSIHDRPPFLFPRPAPIVSIILAEICYNLRSALDYLIFELAREDSGIAQEGTQFPIDDSPEKFADHIPSRLIGVSRPHVAAIDGLQPYRGCTWSQILRDISNPDQHRKLAATGQTHIVEIVRDNRPPWVAHNVRAKRRAKRPDGVEVEVELVASVEILVPIIPINNRTASGPIGFPIEETVEELISKVRDVLEAFKPEFK
jgi:hypothetical protein